MTSAPELLPDPEPDEPRDVRVAREMSRAPLAVGEADDRKRMCEGLYRAAEIARRRSRWYADVAESCVKQAELVEKSMHEVPHD